MKNPATVKNARLMCKTRLGLQCGLTLIELMVALSVFAVLGVLAWRGSTELLETQARLETRFARVAQVDRALARLERDLLGILLPLPPAPGHASEPTFFDRPDTLATLMPGQEPPLAGVAFRTLLQGAQGGRRVAWVLHEDGDLHWWRWPDLGLPPLAETPLTLDPSFSLASSRPEHDRVLAFVAGFSVRYAHAQRWFPQWPPEGMGEAERPAAIEITLTLPDLGPIVRIHALH